MKTENKKCPSCQAMKRRLISIAKGCRSIEKRLEYIDSHDDMCFDRDMVLIQIYQIVTGKWNWPEAMPYDPVTEEDCKEKEKPLEEISDAWNLIGKVCYTYKNKKVRHALMLVRADVAKKNILLATKTSKEGDV